MVFISGSRAGEVGIQLENLAPYVSIPSVRRVVALNARRRWFDGWPEGHPISNARDIYFPKSSISAKSISGFAKRFRGPCVFWQLCHPRAPRASDMFEYHEFGDDSEQRDDNMALARSVSRELDPRWRYERLL